MPTEYSARSFGFARLESRAVVAGFDGGRMTSDAGGLLLGSTDRAIGLVGRFAACFSDHRRADLIEHEVRTRVSQRVFGIALGYEDLVDHDQLRHDPVMSALVGKLAAGRRNCAPLAGKSTLNRLELSRPEPGRYPVRKSDLRHHPPQAPQDRRARHHLRPAHQDRHGIRSSLAARMGARLRPAIRPRLTRLAQPAQPPATSPAKIPAPRQAGRPRSDHRPNAPAKNPATASDGQP